MILNPCNMTTVMIINFNGTCYELELIKAPDVTPIQRACNVDQDFKKS